MSTLLSAYVSKVEKCTVPRERVSDREECTARRLDLHHHVLHEIVFQRPWFKMHDILERLRRRA